MLCLGSFSLFQIPTLVPEFLVRVTGQLASKTKDMVTPTFHGLRYTSTLYSCLSAHSGQRGRQNHLSAQEDATCICHMTHSDTHWLRSPGLHRKCFHPASHLSSPLVTAINVATWKCKITYTTHASLYGQVLLSGATMHDKLTHEHEAMGKTEKLVTQSWSSSVVHRATYKLLASGSAQLSDSSFCKSDNKSLKVHRYHSRFKESPFCPRSPEVYSMYSLFSKWK